MVFERNIADDAGRILCQLNTEYVQVTRRGQQYWTLRSFYAAKLVDVSISTYSTVGTDRIGSHGSQAKAM